MKTPTGATTMTDRRISDGLAKELGDIAKGPLPLSKHEIALLRTWFLEALADRASDIAEIDGLRNLLPDALTMLSLVLAEPETMLSLVLAEPERAEINKGRIERVAARIRAALGNAAGHAALADKEIWRGH
jgi:hypothetical protein